MAVELLLGEKGSRNQTQTQVGHKDHYIQSLRQSSVCIPNQNRISRETHYQHRFPWLLWNGQCRHIRIDYQYLELDYHLFWPFNKWEITYLFHMLLFKKNESFRNLPFDNLSKNLSCSFLRKEKFITKVWLVSKLANAHLIRWWFV